MVSCTRDFTSSFRKTARRWVLTVLVETPNSAAADRFVCPVLISSTTRSSVGVNDAQPVCGRGAAWLTRTPPNTVPAKQIRHRTASRHGADPLIDLGGLDQGVDGLVRSVAHRAAPSRGP